MIKKIILLFMVVLLVGAVSALDFGIDNYKVYDDKASDYGKITVWDTGQIAPSKELAEYTLLENTDVCFMDCEASGTAKLYYDGRLFSNLKFKNRESKSVKLRDDKIYLRVEEEYQDNKYSLKCEDVKGSINGSKNCDWIQDGVEIKTKEVWKEYKGETLKAGEYNWRIVGTKERDESVDWIASSWGEDFTEWAWWNTGYNYRKTVVGLNESIILPINGTGASDVDGNGELEWLYGTGNHSTTYVYYNNSNVTALAAEYTSQFYLVQTNPVTRAVGTPTTNVTTWLPLDRNTSSGEAFDFSSNSYNFTFKDVGKGTENSTTDTGVFDGIHFEGTAACINATSLALNETRGTIMMWIRPDVASKTAGDRILLSADANHYHLSADAGGIEFTMGNTVIFNDLNVWAANELMMLTVTYDGILDSHVLYINGTVNATSDVGFESEAMSGAMGIGCQSTLSAGFYKGDIYDVKFYKHFLSAAEVNETYLATASISGAEEDSSLLEVDLNAPADNYVAPNETITFNCSATDDAGVLNLTLVINDVNNQTDVGGVEKNVSLQYAIDMGEGVGNWSCFASDADGTVSTSTRNYSVSTITTNQYDNPDPIQEGSEVIFNLTINKTGISAASASLQFNNTYYAPSTITPSADEYFFERKVDVPVGWGNATGKVIDWNWNYSVTGRVSNTATTTTNLTIYSMAIDDCSTHPTRLYNFTIVDENTQATLNATDYSTELKIHLDVFGLDNTTIISNYSENFTSINPVSICTNYNLSSTSLIADVQVQYSADNYSTEFYHLQNTELNTANLVRNITLYDLSTANAQEFEITYKDESFLAVDDALIQIQRKYIDEGVFKTVEIPKTDSSGETSASLQLNDVVYTFIIVKDGDILATFSNVVAKCQTPSLSTCRINFNDFSSHIDPGTYTSLDDFAYTLSFDKTTRTVSNVFSIPSGTPEPVVLNVTLYDNLGTTQACTDTLTTSSGTLSCVVPTNVGNGTIIAQITKSDVVMGKSWITMSSDPSVLYGSSLVFLTLFLFLSLIGVGISDNPMVTGVFLLIGSILAVGLNIMSSGAILGAGATILWFVVAIIIVLVKGSKRA